ncbi:anti-sigma factor [Phaeobacter sp. B1627]|uniref:anti-sigma factor family protein n=1 Tax=Phaeobacter sp. B1627 TaxID=2583809 RepID=UPI00111B6B1C|nr:hypothetical protein [Phaeobacter sp. B1627]TNJ45569.1 hypothetical protein FGE21_06335 [Phaeobacter sp. B1627]
MTKASVRISDEDLTAYLDGEADEQLSRGIDRALETDPDLQNRMEALMLPIDALQEAFAVDRLGAPEPPVLDQYAPQSRQSGAPLRLVASVVLAFGIGISGGYLLQPKQAAPGWIDVVASYQSLYMTETVEQTTQAPEMAQAALEQFHSRSGVALASVTAVEGLDFHRAQVLGFNNKPLMQMAYLGEDGTPYALCVITTANADSALTDRMAQGLAATSWTSDGVGYLVIGGQDPSRTRGFAEQMKARLEQG